MSDVPEWMMAIAAERVRIAARSVESVSDLIGTRCRCGASVMISPGSSETPLCMDCRRSDCGIDWPWFEPLGEWHPTVGYASPGLNDYVRPLIESEPYPVPVVSSRGPMALTFPMPAPVMALNEFAREAGWDVRTRYAQGYAPHGSTGRPTALRDSIALRFGNHPITGRQAYACYEKPAAGSAWAWSGIMIWGPDLPPFAGCGVTELKVFLLNPDWTALAVARWVVDIKALRLEQAVATRLRTKERAKTAMPKPREGMS